MHRNSNSKVRHFTWLFLIKNFHHCDYWLCVSPSGWNEVLIGRLAVHQPFRTPDWLHSSLPEGSLLIVNNSDRQAEGWINLTLISLEISCILRDVTHLWVVMTVAQFFGCALIAFGPPIAMFGITIASDPIRTIMLVARFVWKYGTLVVWYFFFRFSFEGGLC